MARTELPHLLFFTNERSGPGRRMESLLAQLARRERARLRVSRVDVDSAGRLSEALGVRRVPTLLLLVDRKPVARIEGRASAPEIDRLLDAHFPEGNPEPRIAA